MTHGIFQDTAISHSHILDHGGHITESESMGMSHDLAFFQA